MRTCQSCGAENPPDRDFCSCGEYLRWEPTGFVPAITPEMAAEAAKQAPPAAPPAPEATAPPQVTPAEPVKPETTGNGHSHPAAPPPPPPPSTAAPLPAVAPQPTPAAPQQPAARTLVRGAVPAQPPAAAPAAPAAPATINLRLPDGEYAKGEVLHQAVAPGERDRVLALVRNQSTIVDNYDLRIDGMPPEWWSIYPGTVYLVPFGAGGASQGGTYEQEVEIHLHPPRGPEAVARVWELQVVADSKAHLTVAASAPLALHIEPYIETATSLRPQRKKGRRKGDFDITVANKANAPVLVALDGEDPDGEMQFAFNRPPQEIPPGGAVKTQMRVKPPKQIWLGRGQERRLEIKTVTGEEAAARAAAEPLGAEVLAQAPPETKKRWWKRRGPRIPGVYGPRVYKPQLYPPDVNLGPGGINVRMPQLRAPQVQGPRMGAVNASQLAKGMSLPGRGGAAAAPAAPLLPTQAVFRQRPWLPWWLLPVVLVLALLLGLLYTRLPQNVVVPELVGAESAFAAEEALTAKGLKLDPAQKTEVNDEKPPGSVIGQTPPKDQEVEKGTPVSVLIAVGSGKVTVPNIVGMTASDAEKALREKELSLGQASPTDAKPEDKIESQIPAANEVVKTGTPINIFYPDPADEEAKKKAEEEAKKKGGAVVGADGGPGGPGSGSEEGAIIVPAVGKDDVGTYAKKVADIGIVPVVERQFNDAPPETVFATEPPGGTKVAANSKLKLFVSVGQPQVVFTNGKNILRVNGANGAKLESVATSPEDEEDPTWNAAGTHVAYTADLQVKVKDMTKEKASAVSLTKAGEKYENLAWAPNPEVNVFAMNDVKDDSDSDLCLANVTGDETDVGCITEPKFAVIRAIHWAPDGKSILAVGVPLPNAGGVFGIVRWRLKKDAEPFSPEINDWGKGRFVTDTDSPGKGVLDAAISPDGKRLALVSNFDSQFFRLWFADDPNDFELTSATPTPARACKVTWRGDSQEVMIVQADAGCEEDVGTIARVSVAGVRNQKELNAQGDDPAYQPVTIGG